jgi:hypothetical protein
MGIDYTQARVFLTRNGKLLGHVFSDMPTSALHVAVGLQSAGERVALNFTGPFSYDIDTHIRGIRDRVRSSLTSPPVPFSGPSSNTARIPRLSGPLPAGTKLPPHSIADAGDRAAAALVLDHLDTNGHARVAAMLRESMSSSRGWLVEQPAPPPIEEAADKPAEAYASPGAAASALVSLVSASGTPRMPLALLACAPLPAAVSRRIKVYELAALAAEASASVSAASERMDVDDDNDVNDAKDEDTRSDTSDADTRVLAVARALRLAAKHERWDSADIALLDAAGAVLAGGAMRARAEETVREARMRDVPVIGRCARGECADETKEKMENKEKKGRTLADGTTEALGVKHHSLLHRAVAQTGLALDVLAQCGDGDAAFVSVREQLGLDAK